MTRKHRLPLRGFQRLEGCWTAGRYFDLRRISVSGGLPERGASESALCLLAEALFDADDLTVANLPDGVTYSNVHRLGIQTVNPVGVQHLMLHRGHAPAGGAPAICKRVDREWRDLQRYLIAASDAAR